MNKNELRAAETKKNLQEAFLQIYTKKEISQITIREITDLAGYKRGTFYLYYHDVYDIFQQVKDDMFQHVSSMANSYFNKQTKLLHEENQNKIFHEITLLIFKAYYEYHTTMIPLVLHDITFVESLKQTILPAIQKHLPLAADSQESVWKRDYLLEYHFTAIVSILRTDIKFLKPADKTTRDSYNTTSAFRVPYAAVWSADPTQDTVFSAPCCLPSAVPRT